MTRQESFKRRVRARMEKTGEKYGAARRALIDQPHQRRWVSEPELSDESVRAATGRGWDEWRDVIDSWPGHADGHGAVVSHLQADHAIDGWWAQTVAVGWERITGRRLRHQQPDGTFTAGKTKTVRVDAELIRAMLLDDGDRADLLPGLESELRSKPASKTIRIAVGTGTVQFALDGLADGRTRVTVAHERLDSPEDVERWKAYWSEWLTALDES